MILKQLVRPIKTIITVAGIILILSFAYKMISYWNTFTTLP
jgi:hypothetical protein